LYFYSNLGFFFLLLFLFLILGVEGPSTSAAETLIETSNSSLSPEHQNISKGVSPRISISPLESDSPEVDSADEGKIKRTFLLNQFLMRKEKFC
jgi:hypothetical protein